MEQKNILKFDDKELFNNKMLHQYDADGQKGFLGYLIRYKQWIIDSNKIIFPEIINSKEKIEKLLTEYNVEILKNNLVIKKLILDDVSAFGVERLEQTIEEESKKIEKREKGTKEEER